MADHLREIEERLREIEERLREIEERGCGRSGRRDEK